MTKLISSAQKLAPWKALSAGEQALLAAFVQVMEHHPVYRVSKISGNVADGVSLGVTRADDVHHRCTLWYGGDGTGNIKADAGCFQASFLQGGGSWQQLPVTIDTLATTVGQITDGLLTVNPSDIDRMDTVEPPVDADPRVLAAIRSITESLKGRAEARAKELPKGIIYVWPDTRLLGEIRVRDGYNNNGIYRYMAVLGDKKHCSNNSFRDQHEAIMSAAEQLRNLSDDYNVSFTKMVDKKRVADTDRVDIITDRLPDSKDWEAAEEKIKDKLRSGVEVADDLARVVEKARKTSEDLSHFGAFADARAFDEYIQEAERAITAVKRISLRPPSFRHPMFGPGMMFHPGKMPHY